MPCDYSRYPPDWATIIRKRILHRSGERRDGKGRIEIDARCEWCGAANHTPHPVTGSQVVLTVAHLDHDEDNWDVRDERLAALCQRCHLTYDAKRHAQNRKYGRGEGQLMLTDPSSGNKAQRSIGTGYHGVIVPRGKPLPGGTVGYSYFPGESERTAIVRD